MILVDVKKLSTLDIEIYFVNKKHWSNRIYASTWCVIAGCENKMKGSLVRNVPFFTMTCKGKSRWWRGDAAGLRRNATIQRSGRIQDRNGREFVMSGVEMTVPFVLKFVGFSRRGIVTWRNYVIRSRQNPLSPRYVEEMSFLQRGWTGRSRALRKIREIGRGSCVCQ